MHHEEVGKDLPVEGSNNYLFKWLACSDVSLKCYDLYKSISKRHGYKITGLQFS
jgi:hypothetical protein